MSKNLATKFLKEDIQKQKDWVKKNTVVKYTKVNIRLDLWEQIKIRAAADNRSATNYIEQLLLADLELPKVSDGTLYPVMKRLIELEKEGRIKVRTNEKN